MNSHHAAASRAAAMLACLMLAGSALAQGTPAVAQPAQPAKVEPKAKPPRVPLLVEQRAIDLIKAASARLAAAEAMSFTAIVDVEYPSKLGPPLAFPVRYDVAMLRPDKLRVLQSGAGAANELYYDGKLMMAFVPEANLVAVAEAPPAIEAALKMASDKAALYYPFMDLLLPDPYGAKDTPLSILPPGVDAWKTPAVNRAQRQVCPNSVSYQRSCPVEVSVSVQPP